MLPIDGEVNATPSCPKTLRWVSSKPLGNDSLIVNRVEDPPETSGLRFAIGWSTSLDGFADRSTDFSAVFLNLGTHAGVCPDLASSRIERVTH